LPFSKPRQLNFAPLKPAEFSTKMLHNVTQAGVNLLSKLPGQVAIHNQLGKVEKMAGQVSQLSLSAQSLSNAARTAEVGRTPQGANIQKGIKEMAAMINGGKGNDAIQNRWGSFVSDIARGGRPVDVMALVQHVVRESYLDNIKNLRDHSDKVKHFNEVKKGIRSHIQSFRQIQSASTQLPDKLRKQEFQVSSESGQFALQQGPTIKTRQELDSHIKELEGQLQTVGDDAQLANVDMQNMLQKQQQTLQMMSQISKQLHDTAMAIVRKIGG
jgi:hypothetical protein